MQSRLAPADRKMAQAARCRALVLLCNVCLAEWATHARAVPVRKTKYIWECQSGACACAFDGFLL